MLTQEPPCSQGLGPCWAGRREELRVHVDRGGEDKEAKLTGKVLGCLSVEMRELGRGLCIYNGGWRDNVWGLGKS